MLESWMKSCRLEELFEANGTLKKKLQKLIQSATIGWRQTPMGTVWSKRRYLVKAGNILYITSLTRW
jgi:phosphoketolase